MPFKLTVRPWNDFFGTFSIPSTPEKTCMRVEYNAPYYAGNYLCTALAGCVLAGLSRSSGVSGLTFAGIAFRLTCRTRGARGHIRGVAGRVRGLFV